MPLAVPPPDYQMVWSDPGAFSGYEGVKYRSGIVNQFDVTKRVMIDIRYGKTSYRFREPKQGTFFPFPVASGGMFKVEGFPLTLQGQGENPDTAYHDWLKNFHVSFQRLYAMRPFEMDEHDRTLWSVIETVVDVENYRMSQPLIVRQEGKVVRARPEPQVIRWADGTTEKVKLAKMPGEFVTFKVGQTFEAMVFRDPVSHKIIKVDYVKRLRQKNLTPEESQKLWDSIPTSSSLPDTTWD